MSRESCPPLTRADVYELQRDMHAAVCGRFYEPIPTTIPAAARLAQDALSGSRRSAAAWLITHLLPVTGYSREGIRAVLWQRAKSRPRSASRQDVAADEAPNTEDWPVLPDLEVDVCVSDFGVPGVTTANMRRARDLAAGMT